MKFKSEIVTQASGSIGGATYARNRGGLYRRARSIPVNPNSPAQMRARNVLGQLAAAWGTILTEEQRLEWGAYADLSPTTDTLGDPLILTGQQMYIRANSIRLNAGGTRIDDGPAVGGLITLSEVSGGGNSETLGLLLVYSSADSWANEEGGLLSIQAGRQIGPAVNFYRAPFRFGEKIDGDDTTAPDGTAAFDNPYGITLIEGNFLFFRVTASGADGRPSNVQMIRAGIG